jgi:hypothetical protein
VLQVGPPRRIIDFIRVLTDDRLESVLGTLAEQEPDAIIQRVRAVEV